MIASVAFLADATDGYHMDGWGGGWMWLWGVAMMTLFVVLVVWLVRVGVASNVPAQHGSTGRAAEILAERYAAGELTTEQYRERSEELK